MENIGDWIYVIIIIIAAISSIFSSIRKKSKESATEAQQTGQPQQTWQQKQAPQPHEIFRGDVFDDDFWGDQTKKPAPAAVKSQPKTKQSSQIPPKQIDYRIFQMDEGQSDNVSIFADNEEEYASITIEDLPSETEEWRKAFIHNEIFNRKY